MKKLSRRNFLELAASAPLLGAAAPFSSPAHATSKAENGKLGVALVGLGNYSRNLLAPALQLTEFCELRGLVTGSPEKVPLWREKYGIANKNIYNYQNMHELANNDDIDIIYIVLPTSMHKQYAIIAANAGKHVWCEKPMAMNVGDCQSIIDACDKNNVQLTVGYRLQHEPNTRTVIDYATSKPHGNVANVIAHAGYKGGAPAPGDWRLNPAMGGGAAYDMGIYPLNAARYATGEEPIAVTARFEVTRPDVFTEVDESAFFTLEFASGVLADCAASVNKSMNRLRVDCDDGWYELNPFQSYTGVKGVTSDGTILNAQIDNQQATQMDNDALAIIKGTKPLVPGIEGLKDIRIMEAVFASVANGNTRIEIT